MTFVMPLPVNLANARLHWRARHRARSDYFKLLDVHQAMGKFPAPPTTPWPRARVTAHLVVGNWMDEDNAMSRAKWSIDWLVTRGYLVDDRRGALTWTGVPTQSVSRKTPPSLTLTLEAA